jgi:hypothetical protein
LAELGDNLAEAHGQFIAAMIGGDLTPLEACWTHGVALAVSTACSERRRSTR